MAIPIIIGILLDDGLDCCDKGNVDKGDVDKGDVVSEEVINKGVVVAKEVVKIICGSKLSVQIYSLLLLIRYQFQFQFLLNLNNYKIC